MEWPTSFDHACTKSSAIESYGRKLAAPGGLGRVLCADFEESRFWRYYFNREMGRVAESGMVCNICTRGPLQNTLVEPFDSKVMRYVAGWSAWSKLSTMPSQQFS